jgi:hypothetical protein
MGSVQALLEDEERVEEKGDLRLPMEKVGQRGPRGRNEALRDLCLIFPPLLCFLQPFAQADNTTEISYTNSRQACDFKPFRK